MRISLSWLKQYLPLTDSPEKISEILTSLGLEVEGMENVEKTQGGLKGVVVGQVKDCVKHPNADKLSLTTVDIGSDSLLQIVCGAPNVASGQKVLVATEGCTLYPKSGEAFTIKKGKIRGEESQGMICAEDELGLGDSHAGIMILSDDAKIGQAAADYFNFESDTIYEIGLTPNRADAMHHLGVAKDLRAWYLVHTDQKMPLCLPAVDELNCDEDRLKLTVTVDSSELCPRYSGICLDNIKIEPSPDWLQAKIRAMDQKPVNNVVDITNYVMYELGQPLHAFDYDRIHGQAIKVKTLNPGEDFITLDGVQRKLTGNELMICNENSEAMCIAGVLGGQESEVSEPTTKIFLESAYFDASTIRRASMKHNIRTQAAKCFEKGTDPTSTVFALQRAVYLLREICGAKIASKVVDIYPNPISKPDIKTDLNTIKSLSGLELSRESLKRVLLALDLELIDHQNDEFTVTAPLNKPDVNRPADLVEEICRVYGLDHIPIPEKIQLSFPKHIKSSYGLKKQLTNFLAAKGLNEIISLSLSSSKHCLQTKIWQEDELLYVQNTSNVHLDVMKPNLVIGGLESIQFNHNRQQMDLQFFEFGKDYARNKDLILERQKLGIWLTGSQYVNNWNETKQKQHDLFSIKKLVTECLHELNITKCTTKELSSDSIFEYGLQWTMGQAIIAECGLLHKKLRQTFDLKKEIFFAQLNIDQIVSLVWNKKSSVYKEFSKFPSVKRDLALVIDKSVRFDQLRQLAQKTIGAQLIETGLFDVYENEKQLGEGKISYAMNFVFEHQEKSFTGDEIEQMMTKLITAYEKQFQAKIR